MGRRSSALLLGALLAGLGGPGAAHDDAWMDRQSTPHGGVLRMAGALHLELVRAPSPMVYVTNHAGQPQATTGAEGTLAVERADGRQEVALQVAGDNALKPVAPITLAPTDTVVLFVKLAGAQAETARFGPAKSTPAPAPSVDHSAHH